MGPRRLLPAHLPTLRSSRPTMRDLSAVYAELKAILQPYAAMLDVKASTGTALYIDTWHVQENKKLLFFGAVELKKNFVSFHFMPVYVEPALLDGVSEELKKRMQGKSCFNFTQIDPVLFKELASLVKRGFARYKGQGFVQ